MRRSGVTVIAALLCLGTLAARQTPQFRSGIELVELDVSVLDTERRPVRGLTKFDFMVLEDGQPQEVVSVAEVNVPDPVDVQTAWMREIPRDVTTNIAGADRLIVLVLDDAQVRMNPVMTRAVREIGRRVIDRLGPADLAAVVFTRNNSGAQPFTPDRSRLLEAVEKFSGGFGGSSGPGDGSAEHFYKASLRTLKYVAESMANAEQRRKAVIFVSPGLPLNASSGLASNPLQQEAQELFREAQRSNVNIYSIDPSGLGALEAEDPVSSALPAEETGRVQTINNDFLHMLAANTGGLAIVNRNEFSAGVTQVFRENGSYYLIGYRSTGDAAPGKYRRIDVRVYRPGLIVRARNGYYGPPPERRAQPGAASPALWKALAAAVPARDVAMQVTAAPFGIAGRKESALALILALRQPPPESARVTERVDVLVGAYSPDGRRRASQRLNAKVILRPEPGTAIQYEVLSQLQLRPGRYQLRFAAESAMQGKRGSVYYDIDVPDFSRNGLMISGMVLSAEPNVPSAPRDAMAKLIPVVPTARRQFWPGDRVRAFVRLYQGGKGALQPVLVRTSIRDDSDRNVFDRSETLPPAMFQKGRSADYLIELPVGSLEIGSYLLTIEANAGGETLERDVRFVRQ